MPPSESLRSVRANSSNNTIFADAKGNIAYLHPQFIPRRDDRFDYSKPVDGSDPATDWRVLHALDEAPRLLNPANGWIMNTNNWPYSAAGPNSPRREAFPRYMDTFGENARGIHAMMVLTGRKDFTLPSLISAAYDSYLPAFAQLIPSLVSAYDRAPASDPLRKRLSGQIALLRNWDYRWGAASMPTSLAVFWGEALWDQVDRSGGRPDIAALERTHSRAEAARAGSGFGPARARFRQLGGGVGRHQPVPAADRRSRSALRRRAPQHPGAVHLRRVGIACLVRRQTANGSKRYYGTNGNSFVAVVEFGDKVRARAVSAGGESGDPNSPHFNDQAERYALGNLREVYFYPAQLKGHTRRTYRPGQ
jgi:acyl-homoserine-lactone acylase